MHHLSVGSAPAGCPRWCRPGRAGRLRGPGSPLGGAPAPGLEESPVATFVATIQDPRLLPAPRLVLVRVPPQRRRPLVQRRLFTRPPPAAGADCGRARAADPLRGPRRLTVPTRQAGCLGGRRLSLRRPRRKARHGLLLDASGPVPPRHLHLDHDALVDAFTADRYRLGPPRRSRGCDGRCAGDQRCRARPGLRRRPGGAAPRPPGTFVGELADVGLVHPPAMAPPRGRRVL